MLMKEISRRRQGALVELYGRHGQRLRTTVESVLREGADADDILQEIFLQIWTEADHYSPKDGRPLGWLKRSHDAVRLIDCADARPIIVRESAIEKTCRNNDERRVVRTIRLCSMIYIIFSRNVWKRCRSSSAKLSSSHSSRDLATPK